MTIHSKDSHSQHIEFIPKPSTGGDT